MGGRDYFDSHLKGSKSTGTKTVWGQESAVKWLCIIQKKGEGTLALSSDLLPQPGTPAHGGGSPY